jgi:phosphatidylinositol-3,4,5-trisphosphate 3-phosphatase/dual-specificity protein phosphatase PTEN
VESKTKKKGKDDTNISLTSLSLVDPEILDNFFDNNSSDLENDYKDKDSDQDTELEKIHEEVNKVNEKKGIRDGNAKTWNLAKRLVSKNKKRYV